MAKKELKITVRRLITWLKGKPPRATYAYGDIYDCALCRFAKEHGFLDVHAGGDTITVDHRVTTLPAEIANAAYPTPWTYGAFLKRLQAA